MIDWIPWEFTLPCLSSISEVVQLGAVLWFTHWQIWLWQEDLLYTATVFPPGVSCIEGWTEVPGSLAVTGGRYIPVLQHEIEFLSSYSLTMACPSCHCLVSGSRLLQCGGKAVRWSLEDTRFASHFCRCSVFFASAPGGLFLSNRSMSKLSSNYRLWR
jgi:hypothetical protein